MATNVTVTHTDGTTVNATIILPDIIRYETTAARMGWPQKIQDAPLLANSFAAWASLKRQGLESMDFEDWLNKLDSIEVPDTNKDTELLPLEQG